MRIGLDASFLFDQYAHRGIGTYGRELYTRLLSDKNHTWVVFGFKNLNANLAELNLKKSKNIEFISLGRPRNSNPLNPFFFKFFYKRKIRSAKLDVYFAPHFERGLPLDIVPTAVMMHDAIPFITRKFSDKGYFINFLKGSFYKRNLNTAKKAQLILANSDFTKRELVNKAGFTEEKVLRVHLGISDVFRAKNISIESRDLRRVLVLYKITTPYLLYYGGLEANKNITNLLHAFNSASTRYPDLKLTIAGKEFKVGWDNKPKPQSKAAQDLLELIDDLKLKHKVIITGEIDPNHLPIVMKGASAFIHLSTYEGFGFSVLEAAAAGIPVIAARRSSYPEILQDAPLFVNPEDPEKVAAGIINVIEDESVRSQMISKGIKVSEQYSWDTTTNAVRDALVRLGSAVTPFRLTYVLPYFFPVKGGAERNCFELASRMAAMGHKVRVITSAREDMEEPATLPDNMQVNYIKRLNKAYYLGFYPGLLFKLLFSRQDLIHVHGFGFIWQDFCLLVRKIFRMRTKMINTPHGPFMALSNYSTPQRLLRFIYTFLQKRFLNKLYTAVIAVNPSQQDWIKNYGIKPQKIAYISNGIPAALLKPVDTKEVSKKFALGKKFVITFIGRYEKYKGLEVVLRALASILPQHKSIKLIAIGEEGAYLHELEALVTELNIEKYVELLVSPSDEAKEKILAASDLFIMASQWEAFGIGMLEAMAKGNAVISTRTEGGRFLVREEENGFLFDYGDDEELGRLVVKLLDDKQLLIKMKKANMEIAAQFTWEKISREYYSFIKRIIK